MNDQPIGIIDSGVGGLSIWQKIALNLPMESIVYLADSKNVPYGNKTQAQIYKFVKLMVEFLLERKVKIIILACNTATVFCLEKIREDFPQIPIIGTVPVVKTAVEKTKNKKIGILSTENTANSNYQKNLIEMFADGCEVVNVGTNELVPFVERGEINGDKISMALGKQLEKFKNQGVDVIALGCTHFPFLRDIITKNMGEKVLILDSGDAIARQAKRVLENTNNLSSQKNPSYSFFTTGNSDKFSKTASLLLKTSSIKAEAIVLENDFANKKIGVIGLGIEGFSSAKFLLKKGALVTILDGKNENELDRDMLLKARELSLNLVLGENYLKNLNDFEIVVRSPGVKRDISELVDFEKKGGIITSSTKIFFDLCPGKIIGITGTKGKGTTSTLIYEMLKAQGLLVYLGGNIGNSPLDFLNELTKDSWTVLELSSFQLLDLKKSPHIAVMLMTTSEHLDYHKDVQKYIDAKRNILKFQSPQDFAILNKDYLSSNESDVFTSGKIYKISREGEVEEGVFVKDDVVWLKEHGEKLTVVDVSEVLLPGKHNLENIGAAIMASVVAGVSLKNIIKVLREFKGLEHRLELVRVVSGVRYYDDSFSTTPETAIAAIEAFESPEILILGGSSKGSNFSELGHVMRSAKNIKAVIGIGEEWERIKEQTRITNSNILVIEGAKDMKTIISAVQKIAESDDVVLLSPACASFGMFKDYKDRGNQFKEEVGKL